MGVLRSLNTTPEGILANLRDRVGDVDRGQTSAALEGPISNLRDRVADIDGGQPRAAIVFRSS